jgi:hypothetical protein
LPNVKRSLEKLVQRAQAAGPPRSDAQIQAAWHRSFLHLHDPIDWCQSALKFKPDPWQADFIRCTDQQVIVNVSRQAGKTTTAAAKVLHRALFYPGSTILLVAPAVSQASEFRVRLEDHMRLLEIEPSVREDNRRALVYKNQSRIIVIAADKDTVRGYTPAMVIEDEAARVPVEVHEALKGSLLVSQGQHILLSTPDGMRGNFSAIWHEPQSGWTHFAATAWKNPRVKRAALEKKRAEYEALGRLWWFEQEYGREEDEGPSFVASAQGLVYPFDRKKNLCPNVLPENRRGWQFVLGVDFGFTDSTAFVVLGWCEDDPHVYVVESFKKRGLLAGEAAAILKGLSQKYKFARIVGDTSGFGKGYVEEARRRFQLPIEAAEKHNKRGFIELMVSDFKTGFLKAFPGNDALIDEWAHLPWDEERELPADGYEDHLSDATLYAWRGACHYLERARQPRPEKGTAEAYALEAEEMLEARIAQVTNKDGEWWEEHQEAEAEVKWLEQSFPTWAN